MTYLFPALVAFLVSFGLCGLLVLLTRTANASDVRHPVRPSSREPDAVDEDANP